MTKIKSSDSDKAVRKNKNVFEATKIGLQGLITVYKTERKLRLLILTSVLVTLLGAFSKISYLQFMFMVFVWIEAIVGEIFNTALEKAMDYASEKEYHPLIKRGKDFASASVLLLSTFAWCYSLITIARQWL